MSDKLTKPVDSWPELRALLSEDTSTAKAPSFGGLVRLLDTHSPAHAHLFHSSAAAAQLRLSVARSCAQLILQSLSTSDAVEASDHADIRVLLLRLVGRLALCPNGDVVCALQVCACVLKTLLQSPAVPLPAGLVRSGVAALCCVHCIGTSVDLRQVPFFSSVQRSAMLCLLQPCAPLRVAAVDLLCALRALPARAAVSMDSLAFMGSLRNLVGDPDAPVRCAVLHGLLLLHSRGARLPLDLFDSVGGVCVSCVDEINADARELALHLVWLLSRLYPGVVKAFPGDDSAAHRLTDEAFSCVSLACTDPNVTVRTTASALLGAFSGADVAPGRLLQAFDKKPIQQALHTSSAAVDSSSSSKKMLFWRPEGTVELPAAAVDEKNADAGSAVADASSSARKDTQRRRHDVSWYGALVHGWEDEFSAVRCAAVQSSCELGLQSQVFAERAVDFLVEMFNDDVDYVRCTAMHSVSRLGKRVRITDEYAKLLLISLEDRAAAVRAAGYRVLQNIDFTSSRDETLMSVVNALRANVQRFPADTELLYATMQQLGRHHGAQIDRKLFQLLQHDPVLVQPEPFLEDASYVGLLVCLYNAAVDNEGIFERLPMHLRHHFEYGRNRYKSLFPQRAQRTREQVGVGSGSVSPAQAQAQEQEQKQAPTQPHDSNGLKRYVCDCMNDLGTAPYPWSSNAGTGRQHDVYASSVKLKCVYKELCALRRMEGPDVAMVDMSRVYVLCLMRCVELLGTSMVQSGPRPATSNETTQSQATTLCHCALQLLCCFVGLSSAQHLHLCHLLFAGISAFYLAPRSSGRTDGVAVPSPLYDGARALLNFAELHGMHDEALLQLQHLLSHSALLGPVHVHTGAAAYSVKQEHKLDDSGAQLRVLFPAQMPLPTMSKAERHNTVKKTAALLMEPRCHVRHQLPPVTIPTKPTPTRIDVRASFSNLFNVNAVRVCVAVKGRSVPLYFSPCAWDFTQVSPLKYDLAFCLELNLTESMGAGGEAPVQLDVSLALDAAAMASGSLLLNAMLQAASCAGVNIPMLPLSPASVLLLEWPKPAVQGHADDAGRGRGRKRKDGERTREWHVQHTDRGRGTKQTRMDRKKEKGGS